MYHFIVNTKSRTGKTAKIWKMLEQYLKEQKIGYQSYLTEYEGHGKALAEEISSLPEEKISLIVVGGDGTVNEVINGIKDFSKIYFGYIPMGSGNDLARGLGIKKGKPLEVLQQILHSSKTRKMDIGCISYGKISRNFAISMGLGLDAYVCKESIGSRLKKILNALGIGSMTYICLTVKSLFTMPTTNARVVFSDKTERYLEKMIFIAGMNQPMEGGGVPMAPKATAFDGRISLCLVHGIPKWKTFFLLPILALGKHEGINGFEVINCKGCEIFIEDEMALHTDGEYCGMHKQIKFQCKAEQLCLLQ